MKKFLSVIVILLCLNAASSAQTPKFKYEFTKFGAPFPDATGKPADTVSVATDGKGMIYVLRRSQAPVLVYNREGKLLNSWGTDLFVDDHNIDVDRNGFIWIGDRNGGVEYKFTKEGKQVMAIGTKGVKGDDASQSGFNRPSDTFVAPNGDVFVADGYDNHRIVQFSKDGKFIKVIGGVPGKGPGQLQGLHGVLMDSKGRLIVLDRRDSDPRVSVWDPQTGKMIEEWGPLGLETGSGFTMDNTDTFYVADTSGRQMITLKDGKIIDRITGIEPQAHQLSWDSGDGSIYIADTGVPGGMIWKLKIQK
jgi:DNA-binding beta-propeller fold protein YncE